MREKASLLEVGPTISFVLYLNFHDFQTLGNIEIAMKILQRTGRKTSNPIDSQYAALQCGLNPLGKDTKEYAVSLLFDSHC